MNADEKKCPFCAETIKAAAVRCRFCQSDLPVHEDAPAEAAPVMETAVEPAPEPDPVALKPASERSPLALRAVLAVVSLALAAGSAWFFTHDRGAERADGLTLGGDQQVVTQSFREQAQREGAERAAAILSYSHKTLAEDEATAKTFLAPDFAEEYAEAMSANRKATLDGRITQKATVVGASLVSLEPRTAKVLVFVDLLTTAGDSPTPRSSKERALVSMTRKDGDWIVTDVDAF